jgi:2'-5' RNA ligase
VSFVQTHSLFRAPPVAVEHFTLFSSHLGKEAAHYVPEVDYELA